MTLTIELPPEIEKRLVGEATDRGVDVAEYALRVLGDYLETLPVNRDEMRGDLALFYEKATPEEWERAFRSWVDSHRRTAQAIPLEALRREHLYDDRGA